MFRALSLRVNMTIHEDQSARFGDSSLFDDVELGDEPVRGSTSSEISTNSNENQASRGASPPVEEDGETSSKALAPIEEELAQVTLLQRVFSIKVLVGLLLAGFIAFVIIDSLTTGHVREAVKSFLDWIQENPVEGFFAFVIVYFVATVLFIPGTILTLGAGFVFSMAFGLGRGVALGSLSVLMGASLGAISAFLLGRYLLREQIEKLSKKYVVFQAIDNALKDKGLDVFILLRLSPIIPFNVINYIGGVSSVSLRDYVIALFAILPGTILYVFLGASAGSLADSANSGQNNTVAIVVVVVGAVFGILAIWLTTRFARRELNKVLEERRAEEVVELSSTTGRSGSADSSVSF